MKTLIITEKPSVARDMAKVLGSFTNKNNYLESDRYIISWAYGHLLELVSPEQYDPAYKFWTLQKLPILPATFLLQPIPSSEKQLKELMSLIKSKQTEKIINACDAGREGELIFRNLLSYSKTKKSHQRLWLSSMTQEAIEKAFQNLQDGSHYDSLADAAKCRSESDWLVGINATRAITRRCGDLFSVGRVQTPTLSIMVEREKEIQAFVNRTYFEVTATFQTDSPKIIYTGKWIQPPPPSENQHEIPDKKTAEALCRKIEGQPACVIEMKRKETRELPPLLFDLTELQREANKRFSFSASRTLSIAQTLYEEKKMITYPRTDSRYLPSDMKAELPEILQSLSHETELSDLAHLALQKGNKNITSRVINNAKITDHFAIIPTKKTPSLANLKPDEKKIFDLIVRRFIGVFFDPAIYDEVFLITECASEKFESKEKTLLKEGYRIVFQDTPQQNHLAALSKQTTSHVLSSDREEKETKPKPRYTEATLLSAMQGAGKFIEEEDLKEAIKDKGIGTPATRAQIIERLIEVEYIQRSGKELIPTEKGQYLIQLLNAIPLPELSSPELTGQWEKKLIAIEKEKLTAQKFMKEMETFTSEMIAKIKSADFDKLEGVTIGICPICQDKVIEKGKLFLCRNKECTLKIGKRILSASITKEIVKSLLTDKRSPKPLWFKSSQGKKFQAYLLLQADGNIQFEFIDLHKVVSDETIGSCPICHGDIIETTGYFECKAENCQFKVNKSILGRSMKKEEIETLLEKKKTKKLSGFWSKKGKPFSASLKVNEQGKVEFDFGE
ncbi:DNA topoisomerase 3 [bacterium]|nr:DNA topoisomerase 3 [bacterium]